MDKKTIANILGDDKLITLTHREFNELVSGYEKKNKLLDEREHQLFERERAVEKYKEGLISVGGFGHGEMFMGEKKALETMQEQVNKENEDRYKELKETLIRNIENTKTRRIERPW